MGLEKKKILISENKRFGTKMVVTHTIVKGRQNRKKEPYIISETKHLGYKIDRNKSDE